MIRLRARHRLFDIAGVGKLTVKVRESHPNRSAAVSNATKMSTKPRNSRTPSLLRWRHAPPTMRSWFRLCHDALPEQPSEPL
jgi:hypothetical protein